ncbi:MAG: formylmethanofuran dehydrogenase subunit B [Candidatus Methylomirabilales bacterium]
MVQSEGQNSANSKTAGQAVVRDVVCAGCADLCDDLQLDIEQKRIVGINVDCPGARDFFLDYRIEQISPMIRGSEVAWDEALEEAANVLSHAKSPLIAGLSSTAGEAQRRAVEVAELLGGCLDVPYAAFYGSRALAFQEIGESSCTLGEVRNRADLVIFWGSEPRETHPRHLARYALDPPGMFVPRGRKDRTLIVVDVQRTPTAEEADLFLHMRADEDYEVLAALRARLNGSTLDVEEVAGIPVKELDSLLERMRGCRYGIVFYGTGLSMSRGWEQNILALLLLEHDLNAFTRFNVMAMRGPLGFANAAGAFKLLTWQTGYPFAVSFARGFSQYNPGEFTASELLERRGVDAALVVGADPLAYLPPQAAAVLKNLPTVVLAPRLNESAKAATVFFPTATYGIGAKGTMFRMDRIPLRLRRVVDSPLPTDESVLLQLLSRLHDLQAQTASPRTRELRTDLRLLKEMRGL